MVAPVIPVFLVCCFTDLRFIYSKFVPEMKYLLTKLYLVVLMGRFDEQAQTDSAEMVSKSGQI